MKTLITFILGIGLCIGLLGQVLAQPIVQPPAQLKVMTYNIWNGFDWGKDSLRKENMIEWIKEKDPDVLALQELCGYTEAMLAKDALKWGHSYVKILKEKGYPTGITSRKPIALKERHTEDLWHGLLHCKTYGFDFFVVHLSPADYDFRMKEAALIAQKVKDLEHDQFFILGDFNALSPFDEVWLKDRKILLDQYQKGTSEKYSNLSSGQFDYAVMSQFLGIPTVDLRTQFMHAKERFTFPSPVLIGEWRKDLEHLEKTRQRIDYILTSPEMARFCKGVSIFNEGRTESLSDHFPVMAHFSF